MVHPEKCLYFSSVASVIKVIGGPVNQGHFYQKAISHLIKTNLITFKCMHPSWLQIKQKKLQNNIKDIGRRPYSLNLKEQ